MSLQLLDVDCLLLLLSYMKLKEQIRLLQSWPDIESLVRGLWQKKYKRIDRCFYHHVKDCNHTEIQIFVALISETLQSVHVGHEMVNFFLELLKHHIFPNVQELELYSLFSVVNSEKEIVQKIAHSLPKLCSFKPHGPHSGKYFTHLKQLVHLSLERCTTFQSKYLIDIIHELQLQSLVLHKCVIPEKMPTIKDITNLCKLEVLRVNSFQLAWLLELNLKNLTNLKELSICGYINLQDRNRLYTQLDSCSDHKHVVSMHTIDIITLAMISGFQRNLKKILFTYHSDAIFKISNYFHNFPNLSEVIFCKCDLYCESDILNLLNSSQQLDLFVIQDCFSFFPKLTINVLDISRSRYKCLTFNINHIRYMRIISTTHAEFLDLEVELDGENDFFQMTTCAIDINFTKLANTFIFSAND